MKEFNSIIKNIKNNKILPLYFLYGEEEFYIDKLTNFIQKKISNSSEIFSNDYIFYGTENFPSLKDIITFCQESSLEDKKKVVLIKEAQYYQDNIFLLLDSYLKKIQYNTIIVINYKYKKIDKRQRVYKILKQKKWIFESKKILDYKIPEWIFNECVYQKIKIQREALYTLYQLCGNNIYQIYNELKKINFYYKDKEITPKIITDNIAFNKEYNIFDLANALGLRSYNLAFKIVFFFSKNEKKIPLIMITNQLFSFFKKIMIIKLLKNESNNTISSLLKINIFYINQYKKSANNYTLKQIIKIFSFFYEYDLKSKGIIKNSNTSNSALLQELVYKILYFF